MTSTFQTGFNSFKKKSLKLSNLLNYKSWGRTNISTNKIRNKQTFAQKSVTLEPITLDSVSVVSNNVLKQEGNLSYTTLFKTKDDQIALLCQSIYNKTVEKTDKLTYYGIMK